jgi:signal transduction histidine kinase
MRAVLRPSPSWSEVLLAIALTAAIELELWAGGHLTSAGHAGAAALVTLPLAFRFRRPIATMTVVSAAVVAEMALGDRSGDPIAAIVAVLLALYAVGSRTAGWRFWAGGVIAAAGILTSVLIREGVNSDLMSAVLAPAAGLLIGRALGVLRFETDALEERASELERERDERAAQAVAEERARMARELHDVIGHSISVMGVQAGAVRSVLRPDQEREREVLLAVERTGRQAVGEIRRLIGLLRTDDERIGDPSPSLKRVEQLAAEMRRAGLAVELRVEGELDAVPPGPDLAGYRIVQEGLTNALKHAPGAHVSARVCATARELSIEVVDDGAGSRARSNGDAGHLGHGLLGMRERTSLYGGELTTGPRPGGGFGVHARIPIEST